MPYSLVWVREKARMTNFYDVDKPQVANWTLREVTGDEVHDDRSLLEYLGIAYAANTQNMGYQRRTAIIFKPGFLDPANPESRGINPEFNLMHEILLHAFANLSDGNVYSLFQSKGLWRMGTGSETVSSWISTDCTCTPEQPGATCTANTAGW
jgi:hypothetical protein